MGEKTEDVGGNPSGALIIKCLPSLPCFCKEVAVFFSATDDYTYSQLFTKTLLHG